MSERTSTDGPRAGVIGPGQLQTSLVRIDVHAQTHPGHHRPNNEDHFFVTRIGRTLETLATNVPAGNLPERAEEVNYVMVVADGMGGHAAGEVASRMAISALVSLALEIPDWIFKVDEEHAHEIEKRIRDRVRQIGAMLVDRGRRDPKLRGMGTTLTAVRSLGRDLMITHVGDSRAYLLRTGKLHRLTRDHTYAQVLIDAGVLAPADVASFRPSQRADQRAWRILRGCPGRHRSAAARTWRPRAALQRRPDRHGRRRRRSRASCGRRRVRATRVSAWCSRRSIAAAGTTSP